MNHDLRGLFFGILFYVTLRYIGCSDSGIQGIVAAIFLAAKIADIKFSKR